MKKAFSLVELMVVVSILAVGIVMVIRSFLTSSRALGISASKIAAMELLGNRMDELEEEAVKEEGLREIASQEGVKVNYRNAVLEKQFSPITEEDKEKEEAFKDLTEGKLTLSWEEGAIENNESIASYFKKKE